MDKALLEFKAWEKVQLCLRGEGNSSGSVRGGCHHMGAGSHAKSIMVWPERRAAHHPRVPPQSDTGGVRPLVTCIFIHSLIHSFRWQ